MSSQIDELQHETEVARAKVASSLDALPDKLTPGEIVHEVVDYARETRAGQFAEKISQKKLPFVALLAGVASVCMAVALRSQRRVTGRESEKSRSEAPGSAPDLWLAHEGWGVERPHHERGENMAETTRGGTWVVARDPEPESQFGERERQRSNDRPRPAREATEARSGEGRGRSAEKPSDIPAKGWKDILLRVYRSISDDRILANAAAVAFYALLALFPGIAALVSIYGLFADPGSIQQHLDSMAGVLPGGAVDVIRDQLNRLAAQPRGTLGVSFTISLLISLWSANGAIKAMFDALNVVYAEREERSFVKLNAITLTFTVAMIGFLLLALAAFVAIPVALNYLPGFMGAVLDIARWPAMLVVVALALACIYRYGPSRDEPKWRWLTWGSTFAAIAWLVFSAIFSFYAGHFGTFNKTYGSLGAVIGFMTWMWLSVVVILVGGKLNAEIEHQTARDTTEGAPKPMGARDAKMADTVGQAQS